MKDFYKLGHNSFGVRGTPWMSGVRSCFKKLKCSCCAGTRSVKPSGVILLQPDTSKGTFWPDAIGEGSGYINTCISERVKKDWENAGFKFGKAWEAKILKPYPKKLQNTPAPTYYWVQAPKGIKLNYEASGYTKLTQCPKCGCVRGKIPLRPQPYVFVPGSWDGSDVFGYVESSGVVFCTQRVLDLAIEKRWTNFWFSSINNIPATQPIPYLKLPKTE